MKSFITAATLVTLVQVAVALTVNTPNGITICQPTKLAWSAGTPPYFVSILPGGQSNGSPIKTFPETQDNSLLWDVGNDVTPGTPITISVKDGNGDEAFTDQVTIRGDANAKCNNNAVSQSGDSTTAAGIAAASGSTTMSSGSARSSATSPASSASGASATSARSSEGASNTASRTSTSPTSSGSAGAATHLGVNTYGFAGVLGLLGLVLF